MRGTQARTRSSGVTLIEALVAVAILAVLAAIAAPSMRGWLLSQRVSSAASEIVTDLRYGRSEAISSNSLVLVIFKNEGKGCYTVFRSPSEGFSDELLCDCTRGAGAACSAPMTELKTFALPPDGEVSITARTGTYELYRPGARLDVELEGADVDITAGPGKSLKVVSSPALPHPTACAPSGSKISGYKECP